VVDDLEDPWNSLYYQQAHSQVVVQTHIQPLFH